MAKAPVTIHCRRLEDITNAFGDKSLEQSIRHAMGRTVEGGGWTSVRALETQSLGRSGPRREARRRQGLAARAATLISFPRLGRGPEVENAFGLFRSRGRGGGAATALPGGSVFSRGGVCAARV
jgi:plasmid stabilization system protein ParE